jgi:uncharacterized protein with FMN-binding domain
MNELSNVKNIGKALDKKFNEVGVKRMFMKKFFIFGLLAVAMSTLSCKSNSLAEIQALLPDMNNKADGLYNGNYILSGTPVKVDLNVTVQNNKIAAINIIKHTCSPIGKKAEKITGKVIEQQSLNVDAISGATGSSKAILKAVENALQ